MPYVDARGKVVLATDAQQEARAKTTVELVENDDGSFSYATHVYLKGTSAVSGEVDFTIGGEAPQADTVGTATVPVVKMRLGASGRDDGLVSDDNPVPTKNDELLALARENHELLAAILEELTD